MIFSVWGIIYFSNILGLPFKWNSSNFGFNTNASTNINNIITIGGTLTANNVYSTGIIYENNTSLSNIYISSNPGDAGGAIGSAVCFISEKFKTNQINGFSAYLGNQYNNNNIEKVINKFGLSNKFSIKKLEDNLLFKTIAKLISKSLVVGWFQGKMEWGPRALGNRSILADPRNPKMREILNNSLFDRLWR